ncbi:MAG: BPSS1780 family membrane protein [Xanthomonadales bacterium]
MSPLPGRQVRVVPPRHGIAWLVQSMALLRAQPGRLLFIAVLLQIIMGLTQVPLVGFLLILSVPALSAGVLQAFRITAEGGRPVPAMLFSPLFSGSHTGRLLSLGALMFAVGILTASLFLSGNELVFDADVLARIEQGDIEALSALDQDTLSRLVIAFVIGISVSGTLSYMTIPLIWFHDRKLGTALADGLRALFVNWKPFLMLGLGMAALLVPVVLLAGILASLAGSAGFLSVILMGLVMILLLAFQLILFATQYCAFCDIFDLESQSIPPAGTDDSQLVA